MKYLEFKFFKNFFLLFFLIIAGFFFFSPSYAEAANRYWVGAAVGCDGTWADIDCWAATSNGAGAAGVPTNADDVFFDGVGNGASNSTLGASITINSLDMTGYTGTLTHNSSVTLTHDSAGVFKLASGMTYTLGSATTSALSFTSTSGITLVTTAGKTLGNITFNGAGGTWQLQDALTYSSSALLTLTAGTFDTNNQTIGGGFFNSSNSNVRTLTMGSSVITLAGNNTGGWDTTTVTNLTITANTATVSITAANPDFISGTKDFNGLSLTRTHTGGNSDFNINAGSSTFANITITGTTQKDGLVTFSGSPTITGTLTINGNSSTNRILVTSNTLGTARTITSAANSISNADFRDITGAGAGSWNLSAITGLSGDAGGNSGITFTSAQTQYWVGGTGSWSTAAEWGTSSGGSGGRVPLPQDDVVFDNGSFNSGSQTATLDMPRAGKSLDFSAYNEGQTPQFTNSVSTSLFGSFTFNSGMTLTTGSTITFEGRGSFTLTNAGKSFGSATISIGMVGGTLTLQDAYTSSNSVILTNGTFNANNFNVTSGGISSTNTTTRGLTMGSGTFTVVGTGTQWNFTTVTGLTFNANTSTIVISNITTTAKTFAGGGLTYNNVTFSGDNITVTGSNTFNTMAVNNGNLANGLKLTAGTTQTVTSLTSNGSVGNVAILVSATASSNATVSDASGTNCTNYMTLTDIVGTGGATWNMGANSTLLRTTGLNNTDCDVVAPTITSVSSDKTNGSYTVGEIIDIDVTFSEAVTSTGNVTVTLETGTTDQTCTFTITNATTGTCNYTVVSGDTTSDLDATISGTIADQSSNAMTNFTPTTSLAANKALVIDTTAPSAPGTPDMTAGTDTGDSSTDDITSDTTPDFTISCENGATVTLYDNVTSVGTGTCSSSTVTITASALSAGTHATMNAKQTDVALNVSSASSNLSVTIDTTAPTITSVSSDKANSSYTTGEVIDIDVTFSETVTSTGNVTVTLETGTTDQTCTFTVSATSTGTCNYTVVSGDTSADLEVSSISGTITDVASNAMSSFTPATNLATNKAIVIDTTPASTPSSGGGSSGSRRRITNPPTFTTPTPSITPSNPIITFIDNIIPSFLKPKPEEKPPEIEIEDLVSKSTPLVFQDAWQLLSPESIDTFVLAPLPGAILNLAQKFPALQKTFKEVDITKITDVTKLQNVELTLPGLTETASFSINGVEPNNLVPLQGIPIANLTPLIKQKLPTEIIFAKTGGELVDFNLVLSISEKGEPEQKISTIAGKPLKLVMKPDKPVASVKGYLVFKSRSNNSLSLEFPSDSLLASVILTSPIFAQAEEKPIIVEEELVLLEFEYTDPDGDGIYTADIEAPVVEGQYEIITVLDFIDPKLGNKQIRLTTVVDPEGYVYAKIGDQELRIKDATVSLYRLNQETKQYEVWGAKEYQQENPQITDITGKYSFLVPPGTYYLKAQAPDYLVYEGKPFEVREGVGVHTNIELKSSSFWFGLESKDTFLISVVALLLALIIILLYKFYHDKIRQV